MPEPIRLILTLQLEMIRQSLLFSKRWLDLWATPPARPTAAPAVVVPMIKRKQGISCLGPADLRG